MPHEIQLSCILKIFMAIKTFFMGHELYWFKFHGKFIGHELYHFKCYGKFTGHEIDNLHFQDHENGVHGFLTSF